MPVLIDTNFLLAISSPSDINHRRARDAMQLIRSGRVVPVPVLPELFYMLSTRTNYLTAVRVFNTLRSSAFQIEALTKADLARMAEIMTEYSDNAFDFTDTAIMALSERLDIDTIYTFDRRDFGVFRPRHRPFLQLLP
jgi:hypothetical protein